MKWSYLYLSKDDFLHSLHYYPHSSDCGKAFSATLVRKKMLIEITLLGFFSLLCAFLTFNILLAHLILYIPTPPLNLGYFQVWFESQANYLFVLPLFNPVHPVHYLYMNPSKLPLWTPTFSPKVCEVMQKFLSLGSKVTRN